MDIGIIISVIIIMWAVMYVTLLIKNKFVAAAKIVKTKHNNLNIQCLSCSSNGKCSEQMKP